MLRYVSLLVRMIKITIGIGSVNHSQVVRQALQMGHKVTVGVSLPCMIFFGQKITKCFQSGQGGMTPSPTLTVRLTVKKHFFYAFSDSAIASSGLQIH